jgi:hypothetical protein
MRTAPSSRQRILQALGTTAILWLVCVTWVSGQAAASPQMAEAVFKNVQILKGIPVDEFMATMGFFAASTGLNCTDCHTDESGGDWSKYADDNDLKRTSRRMMLMVANLNRANFGGRPVVTCSTCHRGSSSPNVMPSLNLLYGTPPPDEPGEPFAQLPGAPTPDQILDKYIAAAGGAERAAALSSLTAKGTYIGFDDADKSPLEMVVNAQGQRNIVARLAGGDSHWTINGASGWIAGPATDRPIPMIPITGQELEGSTIEAQIFFPSRVKQLLRNMRVGAPAILEDDREVQLVQGETAGGAVVTLSFDLETGMLRRLVRYGNSPVGRIVTRVDYSDFRDVAGVKVPFKWTVSWLNGRSGYELSEAQANVAIPAARFAMPPVSRPRR